MIDSFNEIHSARTGLKIINTDLYSAVYFLKQSGQTEY